MIQKASLITVQTLKKSHASQIRIAPDGTELFLKIYGELVLGQIRPIGWVSGEMLDGIPDMREAWLVEYMDNLYWVQAPNNRLGHGREWMRESWIVNLPQIFI
jgi:hypothetical protein